MGISYSNYRLPSIINCTSLTIKIAWFFAQIWKNHCNSGVFPDRGKSVNFMKSSWNVLKNMENHLILEQSLMEKSLNFENGIASTK